MNKLVEYIDVAVIGAGHAGCEASLAAARLGLENTGLRNPIERQRQQYSGTAL